MNKIPQLRERSDEIGQKLAPNRIKTAKQTSLLKIVGSYPVEIACD